MRPKLKPDVYWVPNPEGIAFIHPSSFLTVKGGTALALMDKLAPYLDGTTALDELVADLPDGKKEMVVTLVTALDQAGLVKDVTHDEPHGLSAAELDTYSAEIAYIDYYLDSAARRFERYRLTPTVCIGAGLSFSALVRASLHSGIAQVTAVMTGECTDDADRLEEYGKLAAERDPGQRLVICAAEPGPDGLRAAIAGAGLVLHVSDLEVPARARQLDALCRANGSILVQGVMDGDAAWTGPVTRPEGTGWESAWLRRAGCAPHKAGADPFGPAGTGVSDYLAGPTAAIVANRVSFLAFCELTGITAATSDMPRQAGRRSAGEAAGFGRPARGIISRVDLETLRTTEHRYHPHPGSTAARPETEPEFSARWAAFLTAVAPQGEEFSAAAAGCFDPMVGLFTELDEDELRQLPLCVARAAVADPFTLLDTTGGPMLVTGAGTSLAEARRAAAEAALLAYSALAVDRRRLCSAAAGPAGGLAFAQNLVTGKPELVDAGLVWPALGMAGLPASAVAVPQGLAAGQDADTALARALLSRAVALTAGLAAAPGGGPFPRADLDSLAGEERAARYLEMLRLAQVRVDAYDVTGPVAVPVYALRVSGRIACYAAGCDLAAGLEAVLLGYQGAARPGDAPQLAEAACDDGQTAPARSLARPSWQELAAGFGRLGYQVYARPAGDDPVVTAVLPTIVQVAVRG
jgi:hypothetical protein